MCEMRTNKSGFEIQTCTRCGGSGEYSYCEMYGTRCFKCGGDRVYLTKRGAEAYRFYLAMFDVPVESIEVGNWVKIKGRKKARVISVEEGIQRGSSNGVPYELPVITLGLGTGDHKSSHFVGTLVCKLASTEVLAERLAKAMEYQASLTKLGKPRKGVKS